MAGNQIRAEFGTIEQLAADQGQHAGSVENYRDTLRQHAREALGTLGAGVGSEDHEACMRTVDGLIDDHITATQGFQRTTGTVQETFVSGGHRMREIFRSGAV